MNTFLLVVIILLLLGLALDRSEMGYWPDFQAEALERERKRQRWAFLRRCRSWLAASVVVWWICFFAIFAAMVAIFAAMAVELTLKVVR